MKVVVFGLGYVGITAACCIAERGHQVIGIDVSHEKVEAVNAGRSPIVEPKVQDMLQAAIGVGRLSASTEIGDHLDNADLAIVCVGTPSSTDGSHDMTSVADVTRLIATDLKRRKGSLTVAYRSTFRPGTMDDLICPIFEAIMGDDASRVRLIYNPEFLREGSAVEDYLHPPKIVIGTVDGATDSTMETLHEGMDAPIFNVKFREAEITKLVDNTWHAVKVAFANEIGRVCLSVGISAQKVHEIFIADTKLNVSPYYLRPGGAFGGSCLTKDVRALQHIGMDVGANLHLADSLLRSNDAHKHALFTYATSSIAPGAKVLLAGLAFKADTDDVRESPNIDLARKFVTAGYDLEIFDPAISAQKLLGSNLGYAFRHLPQLERLLVTKETAETSSYDLVVGTNATARQLSLRETIKFVNLESLP